MRFANSLHRKRGAERGPAVISFHRWHYDTRWISEVSCDQSCLEFSWNFRVYGSCRHRAPRRICYSEASETFMGTSRDSAEPLEASWFGSHNFQEFLDSLVKSRRRGFIIINIDKMPGHKFALSKKIILPCSLDIFHTDIHILLSFRYTIFNTFHHFFQYFLFSHFCTLLFKNMIVPTTLYIRLILLIVIYCDELNEMISCNDRKWRWLRRCGVARRQAASTQPE